jgi:XTP/dITP diphosphohydrolase
MKKVILATKNEGKAKEFKEMFAEINVEVLTLLDIEKDIPDIEETGATFEENAIIKAEAIANELSIAVIGDDSGLEVDALDGAPGVYSARYAGLEKSDQANIDKLLYELEGVAEKDRTARFVCVLALARPGHKTITVKGTCEGSIAFNPKGNNGFGYDPVFYPKGMNQTFAELTSDQKNAISHRRKAINLLLEWMKENQFSE